LYYEEVGSDFVLWVEADAVRGEFIGVPERGFCIYDISLLAYI
jgi:hypothetical protein